MSQHGITSARYATADTSDSAPVIFVRNGREESGLANSDNDGGGLASYLAEGGEIERYVPPPASLSDYASAIQSHVDEVAKARGYENGFAMAGYATDPLHAFEAQPFVVWRGQVWVYAYGELAKVQDGQRRQPSVEDLVSELPKIDWPT